MPPSPNAQRKRHPGIGGTSGTVKATAALPGPAHPLTVAVRPTTVGQPPPLHGGTTTCTGARVMQGRPPTGGQFTTTTAVKGPAVAYTWAMLGTVVVTGGDPSPKFHV